MNRITEKRDGFYYDTDECTFNYCSEKLGPLEDIEEERGGNRKLSGYKVTPLFFVYVNDCVEQNGILTFDIKKMQQLNPTIAGKMFFKKLSHKDVKSYYGL